MTGTPSKTVAWRPLAILGMAVLLAHLVLLQGTSAALRASEPHATRPFITRTIELAPAVTPPSAAPKAAAARKPPPAPPAERPPVEALGSTPAPAIEYGPDTATAATEPASAPALEQLAAATPAAPPPPPRGDRARAYAVAAPVRLLYDIAGQIKSFSYSARAELEWRHDGSRYDARLEIGAFLLGSRIQTSSGSLTPEGLAPTRFSDKARSELAAHFERDKGKVIFSANTPEVALQPGAQDHLSIFIQLASLIAGEPGRYPRGSAIEMQAVGARDADIWRFVVDGEERLNLPGGEQATLKLTRVPGQTYDLRVELWLAPALGYLPARIRLTQSNGDFIDQQWRASERP